MLAVAVRSVITIYSVPTASMAPTLLPGDRIVATRYVTDDPARGDVVVFRQPGGEVAVKRVIALPGDLVESDAGGRVRVGGRALDEPYASAGTTGLTPQIVPAGHVFVLGDNRGESVDSRSWGPLPSRMIRGRARVVLWRAGSARRVLQWIE